ncbi:hypothetical protein ACOMHN_038816 [Nucella lapillus]
MATCSVCFEDTATRVQGACIPCGHTFCLHCINQWSQNNRTCPQCRLHVHNIIRLYTGSGDTSTTTGSVRRPYESRTRGTSHRMRNRGYLRYGVSPLFAAPTDDNASGRSATRSGLIRRSHDSETSETRPARGEEEVDQCWG